MGKPKERGENNLIAT